MPDPGPGRADAAENIEAIRDRVAALEAILAVRQRIEMRMIDEAVARAAQSIGVVLDFLAERGLIDKRDVRRHIERNFEREPGQDPDRAARAIDIYGWLIWAETTRDLCPAGRLMAANEVRDPEVAEPA